MQILCNKGKKYDNYYIETLCKLMVTDTKESKGLEIKGLKQIK